MGDGVGKATGLRAALVARDADLELIETWSPGEGVQLPLLAAVAEPALLDGEDGVPDAARGPGRPPGSRNKRTEETLEYLQALGYSSPLRGLAEVWARPVAVLAAELGCSLGHAMEIQLDAMKASLPYWHQRLPQVVELEGMPPLSIAIVDPVALLQSMKDSGDDPTAQVGIRLLHDIAVGGALPAPEAATSDAAPDAAAPDVGPAPPPGRTGDDP